MAKKSTKRRGPQKLYKMKGCSKTVRKGGGNGDVYLAYPANNVPFLPNSHLAYTGKGGACGLNAPPASTMPVNSYAADKTMPNTGPPAGGFNFLNSVRSQHGGGCNCGMPFMSGGCGEMCSVRGGKRATRRARGKARAIARARGQAKAMGKAKAMAGGNPGIPYPNGLAGSPWTPAISGWPGVNGIQGDRNHFPLNTYTNDISRQMVDVGPNPPFVVGGKKGRTRKQRGGTMSNFLTQDLVNLGRQVQFGVGSAYNALSGYSAPVNPLPWKDQYTHA
jgi:hypothetical protein